MQYLFICVTIKILHMYGVNDLAMYYILHAEAMRRTTKNIEKDHFCFCNFFALQSSFFSSWISKQPTRCGTMWYACVRCEGMNTIHKSVDRLSVLRGCQIFLVQTYQNGKSRYTKWPQTIPNGHILYQMVIHDIKRPYIIPNGHKLYQTAVKFTNICIPRPSKIYTNWDFWS
jgi:hypothetical protein